MKQFAFFILLIAGIVIASVKVTPKQNTYKVSGIVKDNRTGDVLEGATVSAFELHNGGTLTTSAGFYELKLAPGNYTITTKYLGYTLKTIRLKVKSDITQNFIIEKDNPLKKYVNTTLMIALLTIFSILFTMVQTKYRLSGLFKGSRTGNVLAGSTFAEQQNVGTITTSATS